VERTPIRQRGNGGENMILIWGWRAVKRRIGTGTFCCPQCGVDTEYHHIAPRRWFTFFFIPMIPMEHLERYVECTRCKGAFIEAVLQAPTLTQFTYELALASRAAFAHLFAQAPTQGDAAEVRALEMLKQAPGVAPDYDRNALWTDAKHFADRELAPQYLRPLAASMALEGREDFLRRCVTLADQLRSRRLAEVDAVLDDFGSALGLSDAHILGIKTAASNVTHRNEEA
jgi:hypothetical protein